MSTSAPGATGTDPTTGLPTGPGTSNVVDKMLQAYSQDIPYLRNPNIEGTSEGQAVKESIASGIRANYDTQRENMKALGAQQGAGMSGVVAEGLARLDVRTLDARADQSHSRGSRA